MSTQLECEFDRIAVADKHIADAEHNLSDQMIRIERMRENGEDLSAMKVILARIDQTLIEWRAQRDIILERIKALERD